MQYNFFSHQKWTAYYEASLAHLFLTKSELNAGNQVLGKPRDASNSVFSLANSLTIERSITSRFKANATLGFQVQSKAFERTSWQTAIRFGVGLSYSF